MHVRTAREQQLRPCVAWLLLHSKLGGWDPGIHAQASLGGVLVLTLALCDLWSFNFSIPPFSHL